MTRVFQLTFENPTAFDCEHQVLSQGPAMESANKFLKQTFNDHLKTFVQQRLYKTLYNYVSDVAKEI